MGDTREIHGRYTGGMRERWRLALERGVVEALGQRRRLGGPRLEEGRPRGSAALYLPCSSSALYLPYSSAALVQHEQRELHLRGQAGAPRRRRPGQRRAWLGVGVGLGFGFRFGSG